MLCFQSDPAFTPFRSRQKLQQLQCHLGDDIEGFTAHFWFMVLTDGNWRLRYLPQLQAILPPSQIISSAFTPAASSFWVVPRIGTISPWSSKATDILQSCLIPGIVRIERGIYFQFIGTKLPAAIPNHYLTKLSQCAFDPLTESLILKQTDLLDIFQHRLPQPLTEINLLSAGKLALQEADARLGLALDEHETEYLLKLYQRLQRNPTDVELMMFAQVNSEHCRHKIFNASWRIDQHDYAQSLFAMIRNTHQQHPQRALVAYRDNAAVLHGSKAQRFFADPNSGEYKFHRENTPFLLKVETHNHPTAISPFPGAATGSGGEIRDESATGRGAYPKAGLCGFVVSHLHIPEFIQPWENISAYNPPALAAPLTIMLQGPIGAAAFNNEFGRPNLTGFFRSFSLEIPVNGATEVRGYHKPIMLAGGIGNIRDMHVHKRELPVGSQLIVLGGPALAIGLGGGAASSKVSGDNAADLDFASVQRANPEMQRRCQEVINACWALGDNNPVLSIHDVGAGGLSNALPELVAACQRGAHLELRQIPNAEPGMTPLEIWCNEAQERFVLACAPQQLAQFTAIAERERCPFAVVGEVTANPQLQLHDAHFANFPVDLPMAALFEEMPPKHCQDTSRVAELFPVDVNNIDLAEAIQRVLQFPCVSSKSFLITIGDRSVTGLVARDQMVGRWQTPVADVAVTCVDYTGYAGEALAIGERPPVALINPAAAARLAVGEAVTNIAAAAISDLAQLALSANWMAAAAHPGEGAALYAAVKAIGLELCPQLGISIPVGKDSLSMHTRWQHDAKSRQVISPLSVVITAAAPVTNVRHTLTPELQLSSGETQLLLIDLGQGKQRLGGSVLAQVYQQLGDEAPDVDAAELLRQFFAAIQSLNQQQLMLAYHDRSDGGLLTTLCEMMFASHCGISLRATAPIPELLAFLFNEELGAVIQVRNDDLPLVMQCLQQHQLAAHTQQIATINSSDELLIMSEQSDCVYQQARHQLQRCWAETSFRLQALRDNPECAQQEFDNLLDVNDPGLTSQLTFKPVNKSYAMGPSNKRPQVAILREQGVNGHVEMAAAFTQVGFRCIDVHMSDIMQGRINLDAFNGIAAGGGFSFGDVFGAGRGWAQSILNHPRSREQFVKFFRRADTFTLGACNGCQMLADLKSLIPGAEAWPAFHHNRSQQFEARLCLVQIEPSPAIFLRDMHASVLPVVVAHGEGLVEFADSEQLYELEQQQLISLRYVDHYHRVTERYPFNPNGSPQGITGLTTPDGRVMILMPHPERVFRSVQYSWHPAEWGEEAPWLQMFANAKAWLDKL